MSARTAGCSGNIATICSPALSAVSRSRSSTGGPPKSALRSDAAGGEGGAGLHHRVTLEKQPEERQPNAEQQPRLSKSTTHTFQQDDLADSSKHIRRTSTLLTIDMLQLGENHDIISDGDVAVFLSNERRRLTSKISSFAYENDRDRILAERQLFEEDFDPEASSGPDTVQSTPTDKSGRLTRGESVIARLPFAQIGQFLGWISLMKWAMTVAIAVIIAFQAGGLILGSHSIVVWKVGMLPDIVGSGPAGLVLAFLFLMAYAMPVSLIAAYLVTYVAPHGGGSGIPEIKAMLNGICMPQAFTFKTWVVRYVGLLMVTSAGLFAGTEGPFAHLGGIVASYCAEGPGCRRWWPIVLAGHRNKCEFIACGASMGIAAAFGAPIGGILFSIEEAASFWSKSLTWRAFLGTMLAAVIAKLAKTGFTSLPVGGFIEFPDKNASFRLWELIAFVPLAVVTGLMGAVFCNTADRILHWRRGFFQLGSPTKRTRRMRMLEVAVVVVFTMCVIFWPAVAMGCRKIDPGWVMDEAYEDSHRRLASLSDTGAPDLRGFICPKGEYSPLAYLLLHSKEQAIKTLFSSKMALGATLDIQSLLVCYVIVMFTTLVTFGAAIPVGLFIPNILAGACLGRVVGQLLEGWGYDVHAGTYALMGAAGALGGFSRMTISIAVIAMEITNNMYLLLPLMMVIMISKQIADQFGPSIYDIVLEANPDVHLLEDSLNEDHHLVLDGLSVHDVCTAGVVVLKTFEAPEDVIKMLMKYPFAGFPVIDTEGRLVGIVTRARLVAVLLKRSADHCLYKAKLPIVRLTEAMPEVTNWKSPVVRAFQHFRCTGLQHLCVIDDTHVLLGILTRTDFAKLCRSGHHGVQEVRALIDQKLEAMETGMIADEPVRFRRTWSPERSTVAPSDVKLSVV